MYPDDNLPTNYLSLDNSQSSSQNTINSDVESENAILGAIIHNPKVLDEVADQLVPDFFYSAKNKAIYQVILELWYMGQEVDELTIEARLKESKMVENTPIVKSINRQFLIELRIRNVLIASNASLAKKIKDAYILRSLTALADELRNDSFSGKNVEAILEKAQTKIYSLAETKADKNIYSIREVIQMAGLETSDLAKEKTTSTIKSGMVDIDKVLGGLHGSDLLILAARPGVGKTSLALKILEKVAIDGAGVLMFSLEMGKEQLVKKIISSLSKLPLRDLHLNNLTQSPQNMTKYSKGVGQAVSLPIWIDDAAGVNIVELKSKARKLKAKHSIGLIIVDYLQLLSSANTSASVNRTQEISEISRGLKILAKDLNVPVIALSQLSRAVEARDDKRPLLSDLRESGSIEQDADIVMFIHRDAMNRKDGDKIDKTQSNAPVAQKENQDPSKGQRADLIIAKHRNGPTGSIELEWIPERATFEDYGYTANEEKRQRQSRGY
jgi:replicative DNA helicase